MTMRDTHWEIEQFLYKEARLIDNRLLDDWLDLWTMDCRYHVPVRHNVAAPIGEGLVAIDDELDGDDGAAWIDDTKMLLFARVMRLRTGKAWSESPLSRTRRIVSNVEVTETGDEDTFQVFSNMIQFRSRREREENWFVCQRQDVILRIGDSYQIKERRVILDSAVLNSSFATFI